MRHEVLWTAEDVYRERDRRLALGYDFDFGDARGVHHFATDDENMKGWNKVTDWAGLQLIVGNTLDWVELDTDTGQVAVVPVEWVAIFQAMTTWQQTLYSAAPTIAAMTPIPGDYTDDARWASPTT